MAGGITDEVFFSVARKAYLQQCRAEGVRAEEPSQKASSQQGTLVVLRSAHRELARYRVLARGGEPDPEALKRTA